MKIFKDQRKFMKAGNQSVGVYSDKQKMLYEDLIQEETKEFLDAVLDEPLANQVKEANDILVVVAGWLQSVGVDANTCWNAVYQNNMLKVANPPIKDEKSKIQKSPEAIQGKKLMMEILEKECARNR